MIKAMTIAGVAAAALLSQSPQTTPTAPSPALRIVVIAGEDAVNVIQQKTAVAPIVEVRDRNNQPVAGAIVTFTIAGQNASFAGAGTLTLTTNAAGQAAAAGLTPTAAGAVQINVAAAFQGQAAAATIAQTNLATAAQAASGSSAAGGSASGGGGGGGGIGAGTISAIGAGAAAAGAAVLLTGKPDEAETSAPVITGVEVDPPVAAQATPVFFRFNVGADEGSTVVWDFGDGTRISSTDFQTVNHTYLSVGSFTTTVTVTDPRGRTATGQVGVTIRSLTGRWIIDVGGVLDFVQSGTALTGTYTAATPQMSGTLNGTVGPGEVPGFQNLAAGVGFTITANNRQQFRFEGSVVGSSSANAITGGIGTSSGIVVWRLTRQ